MTGPDWRTPGPARTMKHRTFTIEPPMKPYLATTGTIFTLIAAAHIWRMIGESTALARDPWFLLLTVLAAALAVWAWRLFRVASRS